MTICGFLDTLTGSIDDDAGVLGQFIDVQSVCVEHTYTAVGQGNSHAAVIHGAVVLGQHGMEGVAAVKDGNIADVVVGILPTAGVVVDFKGACGGRKASRK